MVTNLTSPPPEFAFQRSRSETDYAEFSWTTKEQGLILSGFSFGYVSTQILGGYLAQIYGGKWVVGFSNLGCGLVRDRIQFINKHSASKFSMNIVVGLIN